jgi:peroxiredoxin
MRYIARLLIALALIAGAGNYAQAATPPTVGTKAPDFTLADVKGKPIKFSAVTGDGPVVLVVLRGYPGYQCPFCTRQVHDFVTHAAAFADAGTRVVMVYPGPPGGLSGHADEFLKDAAFPDSFEMLLDPGYSFTNQYGLRWDAPQETAYPSTFILDRTRTVVWEAIGKMHGGRTTAATVLDALPKK